MENLKKKSKLMEDEIGAIARTLDREMTVFERMRINGKTIYRLLVASFIYAGAMALMAAFL